jgi:hypothetical protein
VEYHPNIVHLLLKILPNAKNGFMKLILYLLQNYMVNNQITKLKKKNRKVIRNKRKLKKEKKVSQKRRKK